MDVDVKLPVRVRLVRSVWQVNIPMIRAPVNLVLLVLSPVKGLVHVWHVLKEPDPTPAVPPVKPVPWVPTRLGWMHVNCVLLAPSHWVQVHLLVPLVDVDLKPIQRVCVNSVPQENMHPTI